MFFTLKPAMRIEHSYMAHSPISTLFHTVVKETYYRSTHLTEAVLPSQRILLCHKGVLRN